MLFEAIKDKFNFLLKSLFLCISQKPEPWGLLTQRQSSEGGLSEIIGMRDRSYGKGKDF